MWFTISTGTDPEGKWCCWIFSIALQCFFLHQTGSMIAILNSYLLQHKSISIPGLGTIYLEKIPAMNDFSNRQLLPPSYKFRFDKYFDAPDKEFFSFLASNQELAEYEAIKQYNEFAYDLRDRLRKEEYFNWPQVGMLMRDATGEIQFKSDLIQPGFVQPVPARRVIRQDARHALLVGDQELTTDHMTELLSEEVHVEKESWWIYALIVFAVGLSILFFYLYQHGWQLSSIGGN